MTWYRDYQQLTNGLVFFNNGKLTSEGKVANLANPSLNATISSVTRSNDRFGISNAFDMSSSVYYTADNSSLRPGTSDFCCIVWVKPKNLASLNFGLCGKGGADGTFSTTNRSWSLGWGSTEFYYYKLDSAGNEYGYNVTYTTPNITSWHMITVKVASNRLYVYDNATLINSGGTALNTNAYAAAENSGFIVNGRYYPNTPTYNSFGIGEIGEVLYFIGTVPSEEKIKAIYKLMLTKPDLSSITPNAEGRLII